jgi:hypothetical protein
MKSHATTINRLSVAKMMRCILDGPASVFDLMDESGLCYSTAQRFVHALRHQRVIHVARWDSDTHGRPTRACYSFGDKPNVKRKIKPRPQVAREYRERAKQRALHQAWARAA